MAEALFGKYKTMVQHKIEETSDRLLNDPKQAHQPKETAFDYEFGKPMVTHFAVTHRNGGPTLLVTLKHGARLLIGNTHDFATAEELEGMRQREKDQRALHAANDKEFARRDGKNVETFEERLAIAKAGKMDPKEMFEMFANFMKLMKDAKEETPKAHAAEAKPQERPVNAPVTGRGAQDQSAKTAASQ
jgi:hypothetical protein